MTRSLLALLLLVLAIVTGAAASLGIVAPAGAAGEPGPATQACVACAGSRTIECPVCSGKGKAPVPCFVCEGTGKSRCWIARAAAKGPKLKGYHDGKNVLCPNRACDHGTIRWESSAKTTPCKLCGATGWVRCAECAVAGTPCDACGGRGKVEGPCIDCMGRGALTCASCAAPDAACAVCRNTGRADCIECKGTRVRQGICDECGGRGTKSCETCRGVGKRACGSCGATGRTRMVLTDGTSAGSSKCSACDGRGIETCDACKKGRAKCSQCDGAKSVSAQCTTCDGKPVGCHACGAYRFRVLELEALRLARADSSPERKKKALELYRLAVADAEQAEKFAMDAIAKDRAALPSLTPSARRDSEKEIEGMTKWVEFCRESLKCCRAALAAATNAPK